MCNDSSRLLLLAGLFSSVAWSSVATAQTSAETGPTNTVSQKGAIEDIVVTARRREESLQTTPIAITALSSGDLEERNVVTLDKVAQIAPNVSTYQTSGSLGAAGNSIRGIGYVDLTLGQDAPVGIYIDGVYSGRNNVALLQLVQPERIEVLRGPQGTLFGRNTTGGAINITSRTPDDDFSGMFKASYGTNSEVEIQSRIDTGLLGDSGIKLSMAYQHHEQDGTVNDLSQPSHRDPGAFSSDAYWIKAAGEWGDLSATVSGYYNEITGIPAALQILDASDNLKNYIALSAGYGGTPYTITEKALFTYEGLGYAGPQNIKAKGGALTLQYTFSDNVSLKSITAASGYNRNDPVHYGPSNVTGNLGTVSNPVIEALPSVYSIGPRSSRQRQFTQEVQILGSAGDLEYVAGAFYLHERGSETSTSVLPVGLSAQGTAVKFTSRLEYEVVSKSLAGFGQVSWRPSALDRKLELTGGVRWTKDTKTLDQVFAVARMSRIENTNTSFLASASYRLTPDIMTFVRYSTGYRSGGFALRAGANVDPDYEPEKLRSWEAGFKISGLNRRLQLNGSAFYNKYRNLQVTRFIPANLQNVAETAINADATYKGFELEAQLIPATGLTLRGSVGYVDPQYQAYPIALRSGAVQDGCSPIDSGGTTIAQDCADIALFSSISNWTGNLGMGYEFAPANYGTLSFRVDWSWRSSVPFGTVNNPATDYTLDNRQPAYGLLSARIELSEIPLSGDAVAKLSVYGDNLLNEIYSVNSIDWSFMRTSYWGPRRTVGVAARVDF